MKRDDSQQKLKYVNAGNGKYSINNHQKVELKTKHGTIRYRKKDSIKLNRKAKLFNLKSKQYHSYNKNNGEYSYKNNQKIKGYYKNKQIFKRHIDSKVQYPDKNELTETPVYGIRKKNKIKKGDKYNKNHRFRYMTGTLLKQYTFQTNNSIMQQDDTLSELARARQNYQQMRISAIQGKKVGRVIGKSGKKITKGTYGVGNRTYNAFRGRGFTRTPEQFSLRRKMTDRFKSSRIGNKFKNTQEAMKKTSVFFNPIKRVASNILKNPFTLWGLANILMLLMFVSIFAGGAGIIKQKEFDLTDTWVHLTKVDREKSTEKVIYYSDINDILSYINYKYDKISDTYHLDPKKSMPEQYLGASYLNGIWDDLNADSDNLKTMKILYTDYDKYKLEENEVKEYENILNFSDQSGGRWRQLQELSNFLKDPSDTTGDSTMRIIKRYGYSSKDTLSETSTFTANGSQLLYSPLFGEVSLQDGKVIITSEDKRITFEEVEGIRVFEGQNIKRGEVIGQVKSSGDQVVKYEKQQDYKTEKAKWRSVNIGFYLEKVKYTQSTSVIRDIDISGPKAQRAKEFADIIKKLIPNATNEGIASVLGNFDIESEIKSKMAEGDYLSPPVGASGDSSYDDPSWLDIGGVAIYGRYPNILKRGIGLGQWTDTADGSTRHTLLRQYADSKGKKWYDLDLQIDFMLNGDTPFYKQVFLNTITATDDVAKLTEEFLNKWEGNPGDKVDARIASAKSWFNFLNTSGAVVDNQPLANMKDTRISSGFGEFRRIVLQDGRLYEDVHNGIDLVYNDGRANAPIYSVEAGEVVFAQADSAGGLGVIVKHANYYSYYWHMSSMAVQVGSHVDSGTYLGDMGRTGLSSGVHLHLGFSRGYWSDYFDPTPFMKFE